MKAIFVALFAVVSLGTAAEKPAKPVRLGIVAEGGKWEPFEKLKVHLAAKGYPVELVTFRTYDALVDGLDGGKVDIAWISPLSRLVKPPRVAFFEPHWQVTTFPSPIWRWR